VIEAFASLVRYSRRVNTYLSTETLDLERKWWRSFMATLAPPGPSAPVTSGPGNSTAPFPNPPVAIHIPMLAWVAVAVALLWIVYAFAGVHILPNTWNHFHEFFHDGRHFLGIPCH